jgi:hypothetical protein
MAAAAESGLHELARVAANVPVLGPLLRLLSDAIKVTLLA